MQVLEGQSNVLIDRNPTAVQKNGLLEIEDSEEMSVDNTGSETLALYVTISPLPLSENYSVNADF